MATRSGSSSNNRIEAIAVAALGREMPTLRTKPGEVRLRHSTKALLPAMLPPQLPNGPRQDSLLEDRRWNQRRAPRHFVA